MSEPSSSKVLGVIVADLERSAIGTRSRLADFFDGRPVIRRVLGRLLAVRGVGEVAILAPAAQIDRLWALVGPEDRVRILPLTPRAPSIDARVRSGRAWNLQAWRGGAGQWTAFDEEYHPAAIAGACAASFEKAEGGPGADHLLLVPSHAVFLDVDITSALVHHHLHKNHEMRVTYTPAAPGLSGMVLRADIVREMGEKQVLPWQLLGYDPKAPTFDTLIRDACMQVDPALSKIPNRFCVDTQRSWDLCLTLANKRFESASDLALAAASCVAPGVRDFAAPPWPRELEIELTSERLTHPPGIPPHNSAATPLDPGRWCRWFAGQSLCDDLLVTFGPGVGGGDPLLYAGLSEVLHACRQAGALGIAVQTDLASGIDPLLPAIQDGVVDVIAITTYGHTASTYARVAGVDLHATVLKNMERLASAIKARPEGVPLVVPRLLKVRDTLPELEPFFDAWIERCGWAVIDYPADRAGAIPFAGVVDMAPPKRRPCRRIWDRLILRPDGVAQACDQDLAGKLRLGHIETSGLRQLWQALNPLRSSHAGGRWSELSPCNNCREWHRA